MRAARKPGRFSVRLPADYVHNPTGLGYASTIHAAQGVPADTMHGLLSGQESRQQLYTMLTRGRTANPPLPTSRRRRRSAHCHSTRAVAPSIPTEILQQILARDDTTA